MEEMGYSAFELPVIFHIDAIRLELDLSSVIFIQENPSRNNRGISTKSKPRRLTVIDTQMPITTKIERNIKRKTNEYVFESSIL